MPVLENPQKPRGAILAPFGRDAELLAKALEHNGATAIVCADSDDLLLQTHEGSIDVILLCDDAFSHGGINNIVHALNDRPPDALIPVVLLAGDASQLDHLLQLPGLVAVTKPTKKHILDSVIRSALDARARSRELEANRAQVQQQNLSLERLTDELQSRNVTLAQAIRAKDRFLATMSHELRTPLNAILGYANLLEMQVPGPLNEQQQQHLDRISLSSNHLLELIEGILDLVKANAGSMDLMLEPIDMVALVRDMVELIKPRAESKRIALLTIMPPDHFPMLSGDKLRIRQIVLNLLSNAVKFTENGTIRIQFEINSQGNGSVVFFDTGIGIASDKLPMLFTEFYQADDDLSRRHDGAGLGLAISHRLALLMDGALEVESTVGEGSAFRLTLRAA